MNVVLPNRLTVDQFLAWAVCQPREAGKFELLNGAVVVQHAQRYGHYKVKVAMHRALEAAIKATGVPYYATGEGPTVRIDTSTAFEPDALVAPLPEPEWDSLEVCNPIVVVEVLSPSTARMDVAVKLKRYFEVPSVQHYLILDPEGLTITHHKRGSGDVLEARVLTEGDLHLDPPGLVIEVKDVFGPAAKSAG
jgi:Uma2 family endonuclease